MGRPKGSGKKHTEAAQETVHGTETLKVDIAPAEVVKQPEIGNVSKVDISAYDYRPERVLTYDTWIYSETEPPIILKAGKLMPEGYTAARASIKQFWLMDDQGKFKKG